MIDFVSHRYSEIALALRRLLLDLVQSTEYIHVGYSRSNIENITINIIINIHNSRTKQNKVERVIMFSSGIGAVLSAHGAWSADRGGWCAHAMLNVCASSAARSTRRVDHALC